MTLYDDDDVYTNPNSTDMQEAGDVAERIARQKVSNRNAGGITYHVVKDVELLTERPVERKTVTADTSDTPNILAAAKIVLLVLSGVVVGTVAGVWASSGGAPNLWANSTQQTVDENQQVVGKPTEGTDIAPPPEVKDVSIPEGGSLVGYRVVAEGEISAVSVSWMDGEGKPLSQENVSLPWETNVGMKPDVEPIVGASSAGRGKLTCTILRDGRVIGEPRTVEGNSPTVQCGGFVREQQE